jgi:hypothetical protein
LRHLSLLEQCSSKSPMYLRAYLALLVAHCVRQQLTSYQDFNLYLVSSQNITNMYALLLVDMKYSKAHLVVIYNQKKSFKKC